jgi:hypothetical protein
VRSVRPRTRPCIFCTALVTRSASARDPKYTVSMIFAVRASRWNGAGVPSVDASSPVNATGCVACMSSERCP